MSFPPKLILLFLVQIQFATFVFTEQSKFSTEARLTALEQEMQSMREQMLQMQQSYDRFSGESSTLMNSLYGTVTQANAKTEEKLSNIQRDQLENREVIEESTARLNKLNATLITVNTRTENNLQKIQLAHGGAFYNKGSTFPEHMLENPKARLFTGANNTGNSELYDFKTATYKGGCYNLKNFIGKFKTVDTMEKCVRLFSNTECLGWSQAFYPGNPTEFDSKLNGVRSVGPCVDNEFEFVTIENGSSSVVKSTNMGSSGTLYKVVPNVIGDRFTRSEFNSVSSDSNPITGYLFNWHRNRIEALYGYFYSRHIRTTSQAESNRVSGKSQSFYKYLAINNSTDEVGFALPLELAGPADQVYNVFPQDKTQAEKYRLTFVPSIKQFLTHNTKGWVYLGLNFFYENSVNLRPTGIWYWMKYYDGSKYDLFYGYFPN